MSENPGEPSARETNSARTTPPSHIPPAEWPVDPCAEGDKRHVIASAGPLNKVRSWRYIDALCVCCALDVILFSVLISAAFLTRSVWILGELSDSTMRSM